MVAHRGSMPIPCTNNSTSCFRWCSVKDMLEGPAHTEVALPDGPEDRVVYLPGSGHLGMTDLGRVTPIVTNLLDRGLDTTDSEVTLGAINEEVLAFLDQLQ